MADGAALGERRDHHGRNAEAHQTEVQVDVRARPGVGDAWRAHVVEEASPLVVDDEERAPLPVGRLDERVHDVGHERLAEPHVAERVLVGRDPVAAAAVAKGRVDEGDVGQRARRAVGVVVGHRPRPRGPARAPHRRERQVRVVVARRQQPGWPGTFPGCCRARGRTASPTGCRAVSAGGVVADPSTRLGRPHVVAVGPGRGHQRAVEAVVDRELPAGRMDEPEVALVVVAEGELVVVPSRKPSGSCVVFGSRAAELLAAAGPGVVGVGMPAALPLACAER